MRQHRHGLEAVPNFEQEAELKTYGKAPVPLKAQAIWDSPVMAGLREMTNTIETQQELMVRKAQLDAVLQRIAHEHGVPREAVRASLRQVAVQFGERVVNRLLGNPRGPGGGPRGPPQQPPEAYDIGTPRPPPSPHLQT